MESYNLFNSKKNLKISLNNNSKILKTNNKDKCNLSNDYFDFNSILKTIINWKQKLNYYLNFFTFCLSYLNTNNEYEQKITNKSIFLMNIVQLKKELLEFNDQLNDFSNILQNNNIKIFTYENEIIIKNKYTKFNDIYDTLIKKAQNLCRSEPLLSDLKDEFIINNQNVTTYSQSSKNKNKKISSMTNLKMSIKSINNNSNVYSGSNIINSNTKLFSDELSGDNSGKTERLTHNYCDSISLFHKSKNKLVRINNNINFTDHKNDNNEINNHLTLKNSNSTDKIVLNTKKTGKNILCFKKPNNLNKYIRQNTNTNKKNKINKKLIYSTVKNTSTIINISKKDESKQNISRNNARNFFDFSIKKICKDQKNLNKNLKKCNYSVQGKSFNKLKILTQSPQTEYLNTSHSPDAFYKVMNKFQNNNKYSIKPVNHSMNQRTSNMSGYKKNLADNHKSILINRNTFCNNDIFSNNTFCTLNNSKFLTNNENINSEFYSNVKIGGNNLINDKGYKKKWTGKKNRTINILNSFSSIGNYYSKGISNSIVFNSVNNDKLKKIEGNNHKNNIPICPNCKAIEKENNKLKNQVNSMKIEMNNLNIIFQNLSMKLSNLEEQNSVLKKQNDQITRILYEKNNNSEKNNSKS